MTGRSSAPSMAHPAKRPRRSSQDLESPPSLLSGPVTETSPDDVAQDVTIASSISGSSGKGGQSSNFRNVSACNRCRLRKNRCDQRLPSCASCEKANVSCVGYDPITKREIPRSYVFYLETRVAQLESLLAENSISFPPAENLEYCSRASLNAAVLGSPTEAGQSSYSVPSGTTEAGLSSRTEEYTPSEDMAKPPRKISKTIVPPKKNGGSVSNPRHLGSTTGISFARVVFAAVQSSVSDQRSLSDKDRVRPSNPVPGSTDPVAPVSSTTSMRDSFFGLHTKPTISPATFPNRELGSKLVNLYFEHANPQIPVLHRIDFMRAFEKAYAGDEKDLDPKELYTLNMVFAIGGGIVMGDQPRRDSRQGDGDRSQQCHPEEYHASAIVHLEACLSNSNGGLEELQAVLLLANFALLRPVPPGLWYIVGVAVRLAVDLGLHYEDGKDVDSGLPGTTSKHHNPKMARERGRREYTRDQRRRLWWCTYSFDRLVSTCVGRPFGIQDQVITTEFPSLLEDRYITMEEGFTEPSQPAGEPTYKLVAHHYFRLRLLQSEILQVLQYQQAQSARTSGQNQRNPFIHGDLPSPFLSRYDSFRSWRIDIDRRLYQWKTSAPTKAENGVAFTTDFLDLNYWQSIIMLYRQSLSVPTMFEGEYNTVTEVDTPTVFNAELREDEDRVYLKVAEAGQKILRLYRSLHLVGLVNYTYLATHHLFMAGISYLYAIWHSPIVRSRLSMDEVDFTILAATSVLTDLIDKCPPAEACRDAFDRTAKATIKMSNSTGGFGQTLVRQQQKRSSSSNGLDNRMEWSSPAGNSRHSDQMSSRNRTQRHHQRGPSVSTDQQQQSHHHQRSSLSQYEPDDVSMGGGSFSGSSQHMAQLGQYRVPVKNEQSDGFNMLRRGTLPPHPGPPRSTGSSSDAGGGTAPTPEGAGGMVPSPQQTGASPQQMGTGSPATSMTPQTAGSVGTSSMMSSNQMQTTGGQVAFSPGSINFADLQGMEFLQGLAGGNTTPGGGPMDGGGFSGLGGGLDNQVDFGYGLGWEGNHHEFSEGQQFDLLDGFFFGAGVGGAGAGGMGGGAM